MPVDIYLDVDGVLNAFTVPEDAGGSWTDQREVEVGRFTITYSPELVELFNQLAEQDGVQVHWLTTWLDKAPRELCPAIGLRGEDWPVVGHEEYERGRFSMRWWKLDVMEKVFDPDGNHTVWIDDDWRFDHYAQRWAAQHTLSGKLLVVSPDPDLALTRSEFNNLSEWVAIRART